MIINNRWRHSTGTESESINTDFVVQVFVTRDYETRSVTSRCFDIRMTAKMMNELGKDIRVDSSYSYVDDEHQPFLFEAKESTKKMFIVEFLKKLSPLIKTARSEDGAPAKNNQIQTRAARGFLNALRSLVRLFSAMFFSPQYRPNEKSDKSKKCLYCCTGVLGIAGAILVTIGAVLVVYMPRLIRHVVLKETVLAEESKAYKIWQNPNFPLLMEIRVFNITNYKDYADKKVKPILQEVGPYSGATMFKNAGPVLKVVMTTVFTVTHESLVINATIRQLIWDGWDDPILKTLHQILPNAKYPYTRFAYFYNRNGSHEGQMTVNTGKDDYHKYNLIDTWNGKRVLSNWAGSECNKIRGSPGDLYPPERNKKEPLTYFLPDFCRSFEMPYKKEVERFGIKCYHYESDYRLFANGSENPENACYCHGNCLPSGAMNISTCVFDAPIAISLPHFLHADQRYQDQVIGLKPNASLHNTYADLETGIALDVNVRFQLNAVLENIPGIAQFENVKNAVLPVMWVTQTVRLTSDVIQLIRIGSTTAYIYGEVATYSLIVTGCVLLLIALGYTFFQRRSIKVSEFGT
uniref:Scavenger receptor class B member 1 n=1 Tax=Strigamia maritima TaxID=126957 RepID=T1IPI6_STRMM